MKPPTWQLHDRPSPLITWAVSSGFPKLLRADVMTSHRASWFSTLMAPVVLATLVPGSALAFQLSDAVQESRIREAVVKVSAVMRYPDILRPWAKQSPRDVSGTGLILEGRRILTNAHVVMYASQLMVEGHESGEKLEARVVAVSPGMDLALLELQEEGFFENRPALPRVRTLPEVKETVLVYGYPQGGSSLSVTKGIVSRIEYTGYRDRASGLRIQVDAAINPGNSGGPALIDGKVVGLIFSKLNQADNIGYIIPSEEIDLFLEDVADGRYDGKPMMWDTLQTLENPALRGFLKLDRKTQGMIVNKPAETTEDYPLKKWDLITRIGPDEIDNVGMVRIRENLRLRFFYLVQKHASDGRLPLTVMRDGSVQKVKLPVSAHRPMLIESLQGRYPSYFIYGPLVFSKATTEFCMTLDRAGAPLASSLATIGSPLCSRRGDQPAFEGEELVVVTSPMFPHAIGKGYDNPFSKVVKEINDTKVRNLAHLVELLRDTKDRYTVIGFDDRVSETMVFEHHEALKATEEILADNGIRARASDDLAAIWEQTPPGKH
jgi:S1-C subfamily serine protease